jgi:aminoglycoside phosphotransferase (APT) family kinase protein
VVSPGGRPAALDGSALTWVAQMLGAREVREVQSLSFGIVSDMRLLEADGRQLVLRRYLDDSLLERLPHVIWNEAQVLQAAAPILGRLVPEPVAIDPSGDLAGHPALLMGYLPGVARIHDLDPRRLADPLAALHGSDLVRNLPAFRHWFEPSHAKVPWWSKVPEAWLILGHAVLAPQPVSPPVFLHRDFHPGNLLWEGHDLVGIVDWVFACRGPRGADIAHTRANLALVDGVYAADAFLAAYRALVPAHEHDPWWDAAELFTWDGDFTGVMAFNAFGATFDVDLLRTRADAYAESVASSVLP